MPGVKSNQIIFQFSFFITRLSKMDGDFCEAIIIYKESCLLKYTPTLSFLSPIHSTFIELVSKHAHEY